MVYEFNKINANPFTKQSTVTWKRQRPSYRGKEFFENVCTSFLRNAEVTSLMASRLRKTNK